MDASTASTTLVIRPADAVSDWPGIWAIFEPIAREGESYPLDTNIGEPSARDYWFAPDKSVFVACDDGGRIVASYGLRANSTGPAAHVANAGYIVHPSHRGKGIASALCRHSLEVARSQGFRAMQFNLVVSTNEKAVRLWTGLGFDIVGRLPGAFRRPDGTYVDAYVMNQSLVEE